MESPARLIVRRQQEWANAIRRYQVVLDGESVGALKPGASIELPLPVGHHTLAAALGMASSNHLSFFVAPSQTYRVLIGSTTDVGDVVRAQGLVRFVRLCTRLWQGGFLFARWDEPGWRQH